MPYTRARIKAESTLYPELRLKVLYLNPKSTHEDRKEAIAARGHDIVSAATWADALHLILTCRFDAVVIQDEDEDLEVIDFTIEVNRIRPKLPVFLTSDWESDLPIGLDNITNGAFAAQETRGSLPGTALDVFPFRAISWQRRADPQFGDVRMLRPHGDRLIGTEVTRGLRRS